MLAGQAAATEPDFLALGGDLSALFQSATELAQGIEGTTTRLHTSLTAHRIGGADGLVAAALQAFHDGVREAARELAQLTAMTEGLSAMEPQLARIARVGALLQTIAVGFAVESSRTAECQQAFGSFVDEIRGLSRRITTVENAISGELGRAQGEELAGLRELDTELGAMRELSHQLEQTSADAAGKVQDGVNRTVELMEATRERSSEIRRYTEDAVYQVQFGDITRQKIEHIVTVLREAAEGLVAGRMDLGRAAAEADGILAIQEAQLQAVGEEVATAQRQLEQSFARIAGATAEFVAPLQQQRGGESTRLQGLKTDFERLLELERKGRDLRSRASATAGHAFASAERLARQMQDVQSINREMHLLALNAIVKTAALGGAGATLEVLSMQVHGLYLEAESVLAGIGQQAGRLHQRDAASAACAGGARNEGGAQLRLEEGVGQVRLAYEDFDRAVAESTERVGGQSARLAEAESRLGALRTLVEHLRGQAAELGAVRAMLAPWRCRAEGGSAHGVAELDDRYTMQSQRDIHRRIAGGEAVGKAALARSLERPLPVTAAAAPALVSLSAQARVRSVDPADTNTPRGPEANPPPSSFGDNVELF